MPKVHIFACLVERVSKKVKLMDKITEAVVEEFGAAPGSVTVQLSRRPLLTR